MIFENEINLYNDSAIARKFESQDTQFNVILGKISYLITDSEIAEYDDGHGTLTSRMNTAESNINGNTSSISSLTQTYNSLSGEIEEFESEVNEFTQTTNETFSSITQTVQTKTRTFNTQPTPPYAVNDLWFLNGDLYRCVVAKTSTQSFANSDWQLATNYTSDAALIAFIDDTYGADIENLQTQIDGKIDTWSQSTDPSTAWATISEKLKHTGDLWYKTTDNTTWRYTGSAWQQQEVSTSVLALINGKGRIFTSQPTVPYQVGDLWVQGSTGDILKCVTTKSSGSYSLSDWQKASKYTDDTAFNNFNSNSGYTTFKSFIDQLPNEINLTVQSSGRYVAKASIIAEINASTESSSVKINADKISLNGIVTANNNFKILNDGSMEAVNASFSGDISGSAITGSSFTSAANSKQIKVDAAAVEFRNAYYGYQALAGWITTTYSNPTIGDGAGELLILEPSIEMLLYGTGAYFGVGRASSATATPYQYMIVDSNGTQVESLTATSLYVTGYKNRVVKTEDYATRCLYAYETASPLFGDVGEGVLGDDGLCYVTIDPILAETISTDQYQIFLQSYGDGDCTVIERHGSYFIVSGTPNMEFGWEIKAKQKDYEMDRLGKYIKDNVDITSTDYGQLAIEHMNEIQKGRIAA